MKVLKKIAVILLIAFLAVPAAIVVPKNTQVVQAAKPIRLSKATLTINVGKSKILKVKNTKKKVKWASSNKKVVKVSSKGKVTGVKAGSAYIYAKVGKKKLKCFVVVKSKAKLSSSKMALKINESKTLTVKNTKNKVKWYSLDPKIASVTSKGKVKGITEGTTYITAEVEGVYLVCKVTVSLSVAEAKKNISISYERSDHSGTAIALVTNNNSFPVHVSGTILFYDNADRIISTDTDSIYCIGPRETMPMVFLYPRDTNFDKVIPAHFDLNYNLEAVPNISYASKINTSYNYGANGVVVTLTNASGKKLDTGHVVCLMYDAQGKLLRYESDGLGCKAPGSTSYCTFSYPYNDMLEDIIPSSVKIYICDAYQY